MISAQRIDFHCHLDAGDFAAGRQQTIDRALAAGVTRMITVADPYRPESLRITAELLAANPQISGAVAAHPHNAAEYNGACEKRILASLSMPRMQAIGEAGLDYHYMFSDAALQKSVFRRQIAIARESGLPLIVHSRKAESEILAILADEHFPGRVAFHCFTGTEAEADEIVTRGYFISISGIVTFPKAANVQRVAASLPDEQIFVETDSPYLAPVPHRGTINSPERLPVVHARVAQLRAVDADTLGKQIERNYSLFFGNG